MSLNDSTTWYESEDWLNKVEGIKWTKSSPHYISEIQWNNQDWSFTGEFNFNRCDSLISINVEGCKIDSINILNCPNLKSLSLSNNNLKKVNLSNIPNLKNLEISHNNLTSIDIPELAYIDNIDISYNNLQSLYIPTKTSASSKHIDISNNKLDFSKLYFLSRPEVMGKITYAPQQIFEIAPRLARGLNQISLLGSECNAKWVFKDETPIDPSHYEQPWGGGFFRFRTELKDSIYCQLTHPQYPDLTLKTTNTVVRIKSFEEDTKELFRKFLRQGNNLEILGVAPADTLDWYDLSGWMHMKSIDYYMYGDTYAVGMRIDWTHLNGQLEGELDFSNYLDLDYFKAKNHKFKSLKFPNNKILEIDVQNCGLEKIDLRNTPRLETLNLNNNNLVEIHLSQGSNIKFLYGNNNQLENAEFVKDASNLAFLELNNNRIKKIDLSGKNLQIVRLSNNLISDINIADNTQIRELHLNNNKLSEINLPNNLPLGIINLSKNILTKLDFSAYKYLWKVYLANNKLSEIKLPSNFINPYYESSWENNNLTFLDLPPLKQLYKGPELIFTYGPQGLITINESIDGSIDLKHTGGKEFEWFTKEGSSLTKGDHYSVENGISTFHRKIENEIYCIISNPDYPSLSIQTTNTKITDKGQSIELSTLEDVVKAYSDKAGELTLIAPLESKYVVYNLSGDVVARGTAINTEETISTPSSIYIVRIKTNEGTVNRKVIVR